MPNSAHFSRKFHLRECEVTSKRREIGFCSVFGEALLSGHITSVKFEP